MEHKFWHGRWAEGRIGFHQDEINPYLLEFFSQLSADSGEPVFVPLCGKSKDMWWLAEQGLRVLGVELSQAACEQFFSEAEVDPEVSVQGVFTSFVGNSVELLAGDFFRLGDERLVNTRLVYDRASLIALPPEMRIQYADKMKSLMPIGTRMLLVTLEFESKMGPPFSVSQPEIEALYSDRFNVFKLASVSLEGERDAGKTECVYLLEEK